MVESEKPIIVKDFTYFNELPIGEVIVALQDAGHEYIIATCISGNKYLVPHCSIGPA